MFMGIEFIITNMGVTQMLTIISTNISKFLTNLDFSEIAGNYKYYAGINYHENFYVFMTSWECDDYRGSCPYSILTILAT